MRRFCGICVSRRGQIIFTSFLFACAVLIGYFAGEKPGEAQSVIQCGSPATLSIIIPSGFSSAYQNLSYTKILTASGGTAPYTFSYTSLPTGLSGASNGSVTGTPTVAGVSNVSITIKDSGIVQQSLTTPIPITVWSLKSTQGITLSPTSQSIAPAASGSAEVATLTFSDNSTTTCTSCVFSANPTSIVTINASTGVPTGVASGNGTVTATFGGQTSTPATITVTGSQPSTPTITTASLPVAFLNILYPSQTLVVSGGTGPYTWTISSTPTGMAFNTSTGVFSGTPTAVPAGGSVGLTFTVTDSMSHTSPAVTLTFTVASLASPIALTPSAVTLAVGGTQQLTAMCSWTNGQTFTGCPPLTYHTANSAVATVSATGLITGAGAGGPINITATSGATTSNNVAVTVTSTIAINTASIPGGDLNQTYPSGVQLTASGGTGTGFTFATFSGAPPGLSVSSAGLISGTSTSAAGSPYTWAIKVTDSGSNTVTKNFTVTIATLSGNLTLTPNPFTLNQQQTQQMTATGTYTDGKQFNVTNLVVGGGSLSLGTACVAGSSGAVTSETVTCTIASGQAVYVLCESNTASIACQVPTDSASQTWPATDGGQNDFNSSMNAFHFANSAALTSVTCNASGSTGIMTCAVIPVNNANTANGSIIDGTVQHTSTGTSTAATSLASPAFTTTNANDVIFVGLKAAPQSSWTCSSPFAINSVFNNTRLAVCTEIVSATQSSITPSISWSGSSFAGIITDAFKGAATSTGWSEADVSGSGVATVNQTGLVTGQNTGTATIQACINSNCGTSSATVNAPVDTSLTVTPQSGSGPTGTQITFQATGNNTHNVVSAIWSSSNSAVFSMNGATGTCSSTVGTATVRASFNGANGTINGSTVTNGISCTGTAATGALLTGCTFTGAGGCSIPSGWNLFVQQDFECSGSHASPANPACSTLPSGQLTSVNSTPNGFESTQVHSGSFAFGGQYLGNGDQVNWILGVGPGSFTTIDISFWEFTDSNAQYGNSDYYIFHMVSAGTCGGIPQDIAYDAQPSVLGGPPVSTSFMLPITNGQLGAANCQGFYQEGNGSFNLNMNAGSWRQVEIKYTPSTMVTPNPATNHALTVCTSSTQQNCGNGDIQMWVNGTSVGHSTFANLNGTTSMNGADVEIGGVITDFCDAAETMGANPFSICPGAAPSSFHRYFDDIIILYQ